MTWEIAVPLIVAGMGAGATTYAASQAPKPPKPEKSVPATPQEGGPEAGKKTRKFKPAAQLFDQEDLRLGGKGGAGKLGL